MYKQNLGPETESINQLMNQVWKVIDQFRGVISSDDYDLMLFMLLLQLFLELKTDQTPAVVERIVNDIDAIVRVVRFPGWQHSNSGEREVQSSLRKVLWAKYKIKDQVLFDRAYAYIKEYY